MGHRGTGAVCRIYLGLLNNVATVLMVAGGAAVSKSSKFRRTGDYLYRCGLNLQGAATLVGDTTSICWAVTPT